jgi:glutaredoxin
MSSRVDLYVQPGCADCRAAEEFLRSHGIDFTAYDISEDTAARRRLVEDLGSHATATLVIGGEIITGFLRHRERVATVLGIGQRVED